MYSFAVAELPSRHILLIAKIPSAAAAGTKKPRTCVKNRCGGKTTLYGLLRQPDRVGATCLFYKNLVKKAAVPTFLLLKCRER